MAELSQNQVDGSSGQAEPVGASAPQPGTEAVLERAEVLSRRLERVRAALARATRLRTPAYALLSLLAAAGADGLTVSEAAYTLGIRPQALSGPAAELEAKGLLARQTDPTDNRARRLKITGSGLERLAMTAELKNRLSREVAGQLPAFNVVSLILEKLDSALARALSESNRL